PHRAADEAPPGALRRRSAEALAGDDGAVPEGERQPARRLPADAAADADLPGAVLGAVRERRVAARAVHAVDRRPLVDGSVFRAAAADGREHVRDAADEPGGGRSDAAAHDAADADHVHGAVPVLPGGP